MSDCPLQPELGSTTLVWTQESFSPARNVSHSADKEERSLARVTHTLGAELPVSSMLEIYTSGLDKVSDAMFILLHCCNEDRLVAMVVLTNSHRGFLQCILVKLCYTT